MENKNRMTKLVFVALALFMAVVTFAAAVSVSADDSDCDEYYNMMQQYARMMEERGCDESGGSGCNGLMNSYNRYYQLYQECLAEQEEEEWCYSRFAYNELSYAYKVDNSPYYVSLIRYNGEIMFCLDPTTTLNRCADYSATPSTLTAEQYTKIATAAALYEEEPSHTHYVAAQMYIWKVLGYNHTVNGQDIDYYWNGFEDKVEAALDGKYTSSSSSTVKVTNVEIDLEYDNIMVDLGGSYNNYDTNGKLLRSPYTVVYDEEYSDAIIYGNSKRVQVKNTSIYPSVKTYTISPVNETVTSTTSTASSLEGLGTMYMADYSQNLFSFDGYLESGTTLVEVTNYIGDTFTTTLKTGTLSITKINEYFENAEDGHSYMIWYAVEDENGTATDDNGVTWSKYEVFLSEEDWENGLTESIFTSVERNDIPEIDSPSITGASVYFVILKEVKSGTFSLLSII